MDNSGQFDIVLRQFQTLVYDGLPSQPRKFLGGIHSRPGCFRPALKNYQDRIKTTSFAELIDIMFSSYTHRLPEGSTADSLQFAINGFAYRGSFNWPLTPHDSTKRQSQ